MLGNDCILWDKYVDVKGYGVVKVGGKAKKAHRVAWETAHGPIPEGMMIDHLCRVRHCVNPDHMEVVTNAENQRRGVEARKHCKHGHEFTEENTYLKPHPWGTTRECRECRRRNQREFKQRRKAALGGGQ